jgi:AcrR family transcriptional regulator
MSEGGRREEFLAATRRVVERSGFANATVGEITREAGASLGLLNYHFASKDEAVAEAFAQIARDDLAQLEALSLRHERPADRLASYLELSEWADYESWRLWIDAWGEAVHTETMRATLAEFQNGWRALLARVLVDGVHDGAWACEDPDDMASSLVAVIDGIGLHATLHPEIVSPARAQAWARAIVEGQLGVELSDPPPPRGNPRRSEHVARLELRRSDLDDGPQTVVELCGEARGAWWNERLGAAALEPRLIRLAVDMRRALGPDDGPVTVRCALHRLGHASIRTAESITAADGSTVASAEATLLLNRGLTDDEREALAG